jgi:hypothetical protein
MESLRQILSPDFLLRNSVYTSVLIGFACPLVGFFSLCGGSFSWGWLCRKSPRPESRLHFQCLCGSASSSPSIRPIANTSSPSPVPLFFHCRDPGHGIS